MKNTIEQLDRLCDNKDISKTMKWNWKEAGTYEDTWRNFLNQSYNWKRIINLQKWNIKELWGWVTTMDIWFNPSFQVANILEASRWSGDLDYTWSRGPEIVTNMYSQMVNSYFSTDLFKQEDVIRTSWWTEAITIILDYFKDKKILQCWPWYFMQYGMGNDIKTLFNDDFAGWDKWDFRMLPSVGQIKENLSENGVAWIINPSISGEVYSKDELEKITKIVKEKNAFLVIDWAFNWTEIVEKQDLEVDFTNTIFFTSPSKWQWFPWKRLWLLASKNKDFIDYSVESIWKKRDWLALNIESNSMWSFLELFDAQMSKFPNNSIEKNIKKVLYNTNSDLDIFGPIREIVTVDLMKEYLLWKNRFREVWNEALSEFRVNSGVWKIFSWISGEIKSLFNIFMKLDMKTSDKIKQKYDINEFVRLLFLYNWTLIAPWQNFWWTKEFWDETPIVLRWTLTQSKEKVANAIKQFSLWVNSLIY